MNRFGKDEARAIVDAIREVPRAVIDYRSQNAPDLFRTITLDLSVARTSSNPFEIGFVFQAAYVEEATDNNAFFFLVPNAVSDGMVGAKMRKNGVLNLDQPSRGLFITNEAQAGKSVTIKFFLYSTYIPGSVTVDVNTFVADISVGGATVNNNSGDAVHLGVILDDFVNWITADSIYGQAFYGKKVSNTAVALPTSSFAYVVPTGKKLVVTSIEIFNHTAGTVGGSYMGLGLYSVPVANGWEVINDVSGTWGTGGNLNSPYAQSKILELANAGCESVNPMGDRVANPVFEVVAGNMLGFFIETVGAVPTGLTILEAEVIGYLVDV